MPRALYMDRVTGKMQRQLADKYHTTHLEADSCTVKGEFTVVGIDLREEEVPEGRFIWFHVEHPDNEGGVLFGTSFVSYTAQSRDTLRHAAIKAAKPYIGEEAEAMRQVDAVIDAGGMLL